MCVWERESDSGRYWNTLTLWHTDRPGESEGECLCERERENEWEKKLLEDNEITWLCDIQRHNVVKDLSNLKKTFAI